MIGLLNCSKNSPASVVITNVDGIIEYVNRKFTQVTGYSPEEAIGQNNRLVYMLAFDDLAVAEFRLRLLAGSEKRAREIRGRQRA